tara:strand:- start:7843 stop:8766 length:924 start_codon:yes stop_codon:yes gene_type:complete
MKNEENNPITNIHNIEPNTLEYFLLKALVENGLSLENTQIKLSNTSLEDYIPGNAKSRRDCILRMKKKGIFEDVILKKGKHSANRTFCLSEDITIEVLKKYKSLEKVTLNKSSDNSLKKTTPSLLELQILKEIKRLENSKKESSFQVKDIAYLCGTTVGGCRNSLNRLKEKGLIVNLRFKKGHGIGSTTYKITDNGYLSLKEFNNLEESEEKVKKGYLYVIGKKGEAEYIKIGVTTRDVDSRLKEIQTGNPHPLEVKAIIKDSNYLNLETHIHKILSSEKDNLMGEWFLLNNFTKKVLSNLGLELEG